MEINIRTSVLFLSLLTTALSAGIFYAWVVTVIPGTKQISSSAYVETMQSINREILNPGFFVAFFGALFLLIAVSYLQYKVKVNTTFYLMLAATLVYAIGTIGVTMLGNVPLNNMIEAMDLSTFSAEDYQNARNAYEEKWNQFNLIRTVSSLTSFMLLLLSVIKS